ncbi:hypothetical protein EON64_01890 [archaeon]|nr:MAG: hypothetical protein EON64_01890 [archaeon]
MKGSGSSKSLPSSIPTLTSYPTLLTLTLTPSASVEPTSSHSTPRLVLSPFRPFDASPMPF